MNDYSFKVRLTWLDVHCNKNPIYVFLFWELRGLSPLSTFMYLFIYSQDGSTYFPAAE